MAKNLKAVVTGASSGIGAATVARLCQDGWQVLAVARRKDRLEQLKNQTGCDIAVADITDIDQVNAVAAQIDHCHALINNAGGAFGVDRVADADQSKWQKMFNVNVLGALNMTKVLLPKLIDSGRGDVLLLTSTAAHDTYEGGAGYVAAKHAERAIAQTLRLEMCGQPVRVIEIAPGMVETQEFSLNRLDGDAAAAKAVYAGVEQPLQADDIAECISWALNLPHHVNIDLLMVRPRAQASNYKIHRS